MAKITMLGLETWLQKENKSLFDSLTLPDGYTKADVTDNILMRAGEMEVLFPDPDFLTDAIGLWGKKNYRTFDKWYTALQISYSPLENYDRTETYTDTHTGTDTTAYGKQKNTNSMGKQKTTNVTGEQETENELGAITNTDVLAEQHTTNENTVSAYDASTYQPSDKTEVTADGHTDTHTQQAHTDTSTVGSRTDTSESDAHTDTSEADAHTDTLTHDTEVSHSARIHGNIGVTTSQQMLEAELDIDTWNLYDHIADLFITEFCVMVY